MYKSNLENYDIVIRTFKLKNGKILKWYQTNFDEIQGIYWYCRFIWYLNSLEAKENEIEKHLTTEYFVLD